jgi:phosphoribulokinase
VDTILRRMPDYINHICPQFSLTDINFQRVPTVDTSNPFTIRNIPTPDESFVIIHFRKGARAKWGIDFTYLLDMINGSFMSSPTSIVVDGGKMGFAMELILTPIIHRMIEEKKKLA